ncbi:hypothetical protein ABKN59_009064 [Abortiporus biennis]
MTLTPNAVTVAAVDPATLIPPNPLTPLALLPPEIGVQFEAERVILTGVIGAWIWDFLSSIPDEFTLFTTHKFGFIDAVYIFSRIFTISFMLSTLIVQTSPLGNHCQAVLMLSGIIVCFALPLNSLLFLWRARAIFRSTPWIIYVFYILWLGIVGSAISIPVAFIDAGVNLGPTKYCITKDQKFTLSIPIILLAAFDTVLFFSTAIRLSMGYGVVQDNWKAKLKAFMKGEGLGHFSRRLLRSGQLYFLVAAIVNVISMVDSLDTSIPDVVRSIFAVPNAAILNAMATRVYRNTKLGLIQDPPHLTAQPTSRLTTGSIRFRSKWTSPENSGSDTLGLSDLSTGTTSGSCQLSPTVYSEGSCSTRMFEGGDSEQMGVGDKS